MANSFKVTCPSCDAPVTIKDDSQVGKKTDCPKCKYRFLVSLPDDAGGDDAPEEPKKKSKKPSEALAAVGKGDKPSKGKKKADDDEDDDDKPKKKKKAGTNPTVVIGLAVGGGALLLLVMGAVVMAMMSSDGGGGGSKSQSSTPPPRPASNPGTPAPGAPGNPADPAAPGEPKKDAAPTGPPPAAELTNLLPNKTQSVTSVLFDKFLNDTAPGRALGQAGYTDDYVKAKIGFKLSDVTRFVRGENALAQWAFNVVRHRDAFRKKDVLNALGSDKGPRSPIRDQEYYVAKPNEILDLIEARLPEAGKRKEGNKLVPRTMAYHFYDEQTLLIADLDQIEDFLDHDRKFTKFSELPGSTPAPAAPAQPGQPGQPPAPTPPMPPGAPGAKPVIASTPNWLTVDPELKAILDRLEESKETPVVTQAIDLNALARTQQFLKQPPTLIPAQLIGFTAVGVNLVKFDEFRGSGQVALEFSKEDRARLIDTELRKYLPVGQVLLSKGLNVLVQTKAEAAQAAGQPGQPGVPPGVLPGVPGQPGAGPQPVLGPNGQPVLGPDGLPMVFPDVQPSNPPSVVDLVLRDRTLLFEADVALNETVYTAVYDATRQEMGRVKSVAEMSVGEPQWPLLADAARKFVGELKAFPRGTFERELPAVRAGRPYAPNQRVGWMAELLPMMGRPDVAAMVLKDKSWRDPANHAAGGAVVTAFLNPAYPRDTWTAKPPKVDGREYGATHFVGLAGVGLDAASLPAKAKGRGIFGYDRETKLEDLTDGKENTIFMISVPPTYQRPWLAGGGATVMGVPEKDSAKPFVQLQGNGKRGALALMADGSVRFVSEGVPDAVFKAMVTVAGGDNEDFREKLDENAPKYRPGPKTPPKGR